jgi:hypothetical protein
MNDDFSALEEMPHRVATFVDRFRGDVRQRPGAELFSLLETVCHLRDIERFAYTVRIARMRDEAEPELADVDGAELAREARYNETQEIAQALADLTGLRAANVASLRRLTPEERARTGILEGVGRITIDQLTEKMLEHDRGHLAELDAMAG